MEERVDALPLPDNGKDLLKNTTHIAELYTGYVEFCEESGYGALGRNKFSHEVEKLGFKKVNKTVKVSNQAIKASGFICRILPRSEWREPGEVQKDNPLKLV